MRDVSEAGHELGRGHLEDLPAVVDLRDLLRTRVRSDVARYNADPGPVFTGLVQPADAMRHSDGHHLRAPRELDADLHLAAAEEAVAAGMLWFEVGGETTSDLSHRVDVEAHDEVVAVMRRPVVARDA
jgi:hypothetical protein